MLDRYVAKIGQSDRRDSALLKDVVALTIALPSAEREMLVKQLRAVGWTATNAAGAVVCRGPDAERVDVVSPVRARSGIVEVEFSLQHAVAKAVRPIGSAELRLEDVRARLLLVRHPAHAETTFGPGAGDRRSPVAGLSPGEATSPTRPGGAARLQERDVLGVARRGAVGASDP